MNQVKVAIIATHPIQYQVPLYRSLASQKKIALKVYYALLPDQQQQGLGFGIPFTWDIPLMEGYSWEVLANRARTPGLRGFFNSSTPEIKAVLYREKPDVMIITGWQSLPLLQALWACRRLSIPRIAMGESNALKKRSWWVRIPHSIVLTGYDAFLGIGRANRDFYTGYGIEPERIFPCRYFVDNERFRTASERLFIERENIRASWGIREDKTCFVYAGKLEPKKRIMDLLHAVERAYKINPHIHLLIAGTGELKEMARQFVNEWELPVTFAGFLNQTEMPRAYTAGDCLILPSDFGETWGLVVNEAMVCGLPAIVSDRVGCGPDLVENDITGFVFPFGDIEALAGRLVDMASDTAARLQMGENAGERIKKYSVENAVDGILQAINFVIEKADR